MVEQGPVMMVSGARYRGELDIHICMYRESVQYTCISQARCYICTCTCTGALYVSIRNIPNWKLDSFPAVCHVVETVVM